MAEDSGTFKTNPRNSARFGQFVISPKHRCHQASPAKELFLRQAGKRSRRRFLASLAKRLRYSEAA
jgi:hypothetical protein